MERILSEQEIASISSIESMEQLKIFLGNMESKIKEKLGFDQILAKHFLDKIIPKVREFRLIDENNNFRPGANHLVADIIKGVTREAINLKENLCCD